MASAGLVTVGGLATGLDTNQIISQLVAAASAPVTLLQNQLAAVQATQSSIGTLAGDLSTLSTTSGVLVQQAASSDESVVTAAAGAGAQNGAVTLNVIQLAHGSTATSSIGLAASSDTVATGPGTFQFQVGSGPVQSVAVDSTTTLDALVSAI